jgi:hypothetical protein
VNSNHVYQMEKLFKTSGIEQEIIDHFIFYVESVEMLKLFLRYGGDMHKLGPPRSPDPVSLLVFNSSGLDEGKDSSRVKLVKVISLF